MLIYFREGSSSGADQELEDAVGRSWIAEVGLDHRVELRQGAFAETTGAHDSLTCLSDTKLIHLKRLIHSKFNLTFWWDPIWGDFSNFLWIFHDSWGFFKIFKMDLWIFEEIFRIFAGFNDWNIFISILTDPTNQSTWNGQEFNWFRVK